MSLDGRQGSFTLAAARPNRTARPASDWNALQRRTFPGVYACSKQDDEIGMLKVANIIEDARIAGPQVRIVRVAYALKKDVNTVVIMPKAKSQEFGQLCAQKDIKVAKVRLSTLSRSLPGLVRYGLTFPIEVAGLAITLRRLGVDLVHVSGGSWQYKGVLAARLCGVPVVWHLNDSYAPRVIRRVFSFLSSLANGWIFASEATREYYWEDIRTAQAWSIVPSAISTAGASPDPRSQPAGIPDEASNTESAETAPTIGCVVSVNPIKDIETLVRAAKIVQEQYPSLNVVIVGPVYDSQKQYYKHLVDLAESLGLKNLRWEGYHRNIDGLLANFDVYVCSSKAESSPLAVWEAMSMGCPVVSTDVGDVSLHVNNAQCGRIVSVGDPAALAAGICELLGDEELSTRLSQNAVFYAAKSFSEAAIAEKTLAIYRKVVGRRQD